MDDKARAEKAKALAAALAQIEKQFGKGTIMRLGEGEALEDIQVVSTGSLGLDIALGVGGLGRRAHGWHVPAGQVSQVVFVPARIHDGLGRSPILELRDDLLHCLQLPGQISRRREIEPAHAPREMLAHVPCLLAPEIGETPVTVLVMTGLTVTHQVDDTHGHHLAVRWAAPRHRSRRGALIVCNGES